MSAGLRQGDICTVTAWPDWNVQSTVTSRSASGEIVSLGLATNSRILSWTDAEKRLVVVCSYDCDIENPRSRTGILLAPLIKVPAQPTSAHYQGIMTSGQAIENVYTYLNLFPLSLPLPDTGIVDCVADLSSIQSLQKAEPAVAALEQTKLLEMHEETRSAFRTKLAVFVGRPGEPQDSGS